MLKPRKFALLAACAVLSAPSVAHAAVVANVTGTVLISKGSGFDVVAGDTELAPGGRVLVQPGSVAMITYPSGCAVRVGAGIWQVQPMAPCAQGTHELDFSGRMNDGILSGGGLPPPPDYTRGVDAGLLIGGGVVAFGLGIVCITEWCTSRPTGKKPASP
jgi:hypothetical protein